MKAGAIVVAAGAGRRFGRPKAFVELEGEPLVRHAVRRFLEAGGVSEIVVVVPEETLDEGRSALSRLGMTCRVVAGGRTRQESVARGLFALSADVDVVAIHDAARPLTPPEVIRTTFERAAEGGAALAAVPVTDTIKEVDDRGCVVATRSREGLWVAQTPQTFRRSLIEKAHTAARDASHVATDDAALVERIGGRVEIVPSTGANLKITVPEDLDLARALLRKPRGPG